MDKKLKIISTSVVIIGALIIFILLAILLFAPTPKTESNSKFRGPTSAPYVSGPKENPPQ